MKKFLLISTLLAGLSGAQPGFAQQALPNDQSTSAMTEIGLGAVDGNYHGNHDGSVGVESMVTSITNGSPNGGPNTYAAGHAGLDVDVTPGDTGIAVNAQEKTGINLWTQHGDQVVVPLLGLEPLNSSMGSSLGFQNATTTQTNALGQTSASTQSFPHGITGHDTYFEWSPMAAVGVQVLGDTCKAMLAIRGGASIGTLGDGGIRPAYGAGVSGVCQNLVQFDAEVMRIPGKTQDVDMADASAFFQIPGQHFGIGAIVDARDAKAASQDVFSMPVPGAANAEVSGQVAIGGTF